MKAGPGAEVDVAEEIRRVVPFVAAVRARHPERGDQRGHVAGRGGPSRRARKAPTCSTTPGRAPTRAGRRSPPSSASASSARTPGRGAAAAVRTGCATPTWWPTVIAEVTGQAERLVARGVPREGILVDPTHDFGKNTFHGLALLRHCDQLVATGWPVLMALSNKDFVGETLGVTERRRPAGGHARGHRARRGGGRAGVPRPRGGGHPTYRGDGRVDRRHQGTCPHGPRVGVKRRGNEAAPTRT